MYELTMITYLLPPSEGKKFGGVLSSEKLSFDFDKPVAIAENASQKDLKCSGNRYEEGIMLNRLIVQGPFMEAIKRYSGVMYKAIDFDTFDEKQKQMFSQSVLILSGMYGVVKPDDHIGNYKLPISTKGLINFRGKEITSQLNTLPQTQLIDLLPGSYKKMIYRDELKHEVVHCDFYQEGKKVTHSVKGVKGRWLHDQIQQGVSLYTVGDSVFEDKEGHITVCIS